VKNSGGREGKEEGVQVYMGEDVSRVGGKVDCEGERKS
jgi:hypothetical protein